MSPKRHRKYLPGEATPADVARIVDEWQKANTPPLQTLATVQAIIAALATPEKSGNAVIAELTRPSPQEQGMSPQHIYNSKVADRLPAKTYLVLTAALAARGYEASPELWGMLMPSERAEPVSTQSNSGDE